MSSHRMIRGRLCSQQRLTRWPVIMLLLLRQLTLMSFSSVTLTQKAAAVAAAFSELRMATTQRAATTMSTTLAFSQNSRTSADTESADTSRPTAVGKVIKQTAVLDGAEWVSVRSRLLLQKAQREGNPPAYARTILGVYTAITGSVDGKRVVGMQAHVPTPIESSSEETVTLDQDSSVHLYKESVAEIPDTVTEVEALWTLLQSLSVIHCVRPIVSNVGGSGVSEFLREGKVVVLGGNELAVTAATALSELDCQVALVATEKPSGLHSTIRHLTPAVGEENLGFSTVLGKFDSVLDTLGDEQDDVPGGSTVTKQLAALHGCHTYVSAFTESQEIIVKNGLIWGPAKSTDHVAKLQSRAAKATAAQFPSPAAFGSTVQTLLEKGIMLAAPKEQKAETVFVRGWSLKDFWDYTTWPRDAASNVRFGFPGTDDSFYDYGNEEVEDDGPMISAPPLRPEDVRPEMYAVPGDGDEIENPYVVGINGVKGLQRIVEDETSCLLFLSAPFCRTCRYLKPQYQRMARTYIDTASDKGKELDFVFVQAEANGLAGKELGRALGIVSVPSFVFFKNGRRFGTPLSISRLPSKKLELAIAYLQQDMPWDDAVFKDEQEGLEGGSGRGATNRSKLL